MIQCFAVSLCSIETIKIGKIVFFVKELAEDHAFLHIPQPITDSKDDKYSEFNHMKEHIPYYIVADVQITIIESSRLSCFIT